MTTELVRQDSYARASLDEKYRYVQALANAGDLLPKALMGRPTPNPAGGMFPARVEPAKILLMAETGAMLGIHPMAALQGIYIVEGKPTLSANLLAALVRRAGHKLRVTTSGSWKAGDFVARAVLIRSDDPDFEFVVEWNQEKAERAGLLNKDVWKKYGEAMTKSRAITEVIREGAPDVTLVAAYTPEELGAAVNEEGEAIDLQQVPPYSEAPAPQAPAPTPAEPRKETPIPDATKPVDEETFDWAKAVAGLTSRDEALALHGKARTEGKLDLEIKVGRKKRKLGDYIVEVGTALTEAEKQAAAQEDVVEGEIVEDDAPMDLGGDQ